MWMDESLSTTTSTHFYFYVVVPTTADNFFPYGKLYCTKCIKMKRVAATNFIPMIHCSSFDGVKSYFYRNQAIRNHLCH
tara:strand:+ start:290 stop:526 length:237 start_codon:yes stop_codon:yes gene_type:complete